LATGTAGSGDDARRAVALASKGAGRTADLAAVPPVRRDTPDSESVDGSQTDPADAGNAHHDVSRFTIDRFVSPRCSAHVNSRVCFPVYTSTQSRYVGYLIRMQVVSIVYCRGLLL
jgi:hypothetical protein